MTHYEVLGIPRDATPQQIRAAWRRAAKATHTDHGGSKEGYLRARKAYDVLKDPALRQRYDATGDDAGKRVWVSSTEAVITQIMGRELTTNERLGARLLDSLLPLLPLLRTP